MLQLQRTIALTTIRFFWLCIVHLIGNEANTPPFLGETEATWTLDELLLDEMRKDNADLSTEINPVQMLKSKLYMIFGDDEVGALFAIKHSNQFVKSSPAYQNIMTDTFARGISLYSMAIKTGESKYKRHAREVHQTIRNWKKKQNPNVIHHVALLDAEEATLNGKFEKAESLYQSAKMLASNAGILPDAALAAERMAEMLLLRVQVGHSLQRKTEAVTMLEEAINLYSEWGSKKKVEQLQRKCDSIRRTGSIGGSE